jgi:hypothetical protein
LSSALPELLAAFDAFLQEHLRCGELDGGVEGDRVFWMACECGARAPFHIGDGERPHLAGGLQDLRDDTGPLVRRLPCCTRGSKLGAMPIPVSLPRLGTNLPPPRSAGAEQSRPGPAAPRRRSIRAQRPSGWRAAIAGLYRLRSGCAGHTKGPKVSTFWALLRARRGPVLRPDARPCPA